MLEKKEGNGEEEKNKKKEQKTYLFVLGPNNKKLPQEFIFKKYNLLTRAKNFNLMTVNCFDLKGINIQIYKSRQLDTTQGKSYHWMTIFLLHKCYTITIQ